MQQRTEAELLIFWWLRTRQLAAVEMSVCWDFRYCLATAEIKIMSQSLKTSRW